MGASELLLIAKAADDAYHVSEVYSPFENVYKKYSPFATDTYRLDFNGNTQNAFGRELVCTIPMDVGHLLSDLILAISINYTTPDALDDEDEPIDPLETPSPWGYSYFEYVSLYFDDKEIDRLYSDWIFTHTSLLVNKKHHSAINSMQCANVPQITRNGRDYRTMYVRLPFWFVLEWVLALPLCALRQTRVSLRVRFSSRPDVSFRVSNAGNAGTVNSSLSIDNIHLFAGIVWLGPEEHRAISNAKSIRYNVLRSQYSIVNPIAPSTQAGVTERILVNFTGRLVDLFWMVQTEQATAGVLQNRRNRGQFRFSYWRNFRRLNDQITSASFYIDGKETDALPAVYYRSCIPSTYYRGGGIADSFDGAFVTNATQTANIQELFSGSGIYVYSWALYPLQAHLQPSGFLNLGKTSRMELRLRMAASEATTRRNALLFARTLDVLEIKGGQGGLILE
jgi:hypothetical protein